MGELGKQCKIYTEMIDSSVLILGSIGLDTIQTQYGERSELLGGSATYATIAAGLFSPVHLVGIVGTDFPEPAYKLLLKYTANTKDLIIKEGLTFRWGGRYPGNGDNRDTLFTKLGVFSDFNPILSDENKKVKWVFLANIHPSLQIDVLNQCVDAPFVVTDTMNLWIRTTPTELNEIISRTNILLINESELKEYTGIDRVRAGAEKILLMGPEKVIVKLGSRGSICIDKNQEIKTGVYPVPEVLDPTGAGDVFGGGFISGLSEGLSIIDAMRRGTALASFCIEDFGVAMLDNITKDDIDHRIFELEN